MTTASIAKALATAQKNMGRALKDSTNPAFRSKYADLASVMDACMGALNEAGIAVIQPTGEDDRGRYVETTLIHESGENLSCRVPLILGKNDMQGYGSAVTYARRYGLMSMAGIAPEDDDGNAAVKAAPKAEKARPQEQAENPTTEALDQAWGDAILDRLPENATAAQKADAFAEAIIMGFQAKTGIKALENEWSRRSKTIAWIEAKFPALYNDLLDAYEVKRKALLGDITTPN